VTYEEAIRVCTRPDERISYSSNALTYFCEHGPPLPTTGVSPETHPERYTSHLASPLSVLLGEIARSTGQQVTYYPTASHGIAAGLRIGDCPAGSYAVGSKCVKNWADEFDAGQYLTDVGVGIAKGVAFLAPALTGAGALAAAAWAASNFTQTLQQSGALKMGLDLGGIFGGLSNVVGGFSSGNYLGALQGGLQIAGSAFAPSPQPMSYGPVYSPPPQIYQQPQIIQAQPVMGVFPAGAAAMTRLAAITAPILAKIAVKLGLRSRPSLNRAMDLIRKSAKILTSPEAVAAALGVTVAELAQLITAHGARKRRRMNPANSKALRRASRRIKSFHKLCTHTDVLKGRGRRSSPGRCVSCKKSPCRC
jgi:hypothetical protein